MIMENCEQKNFFMNFHYHGNDMIHIMKNLQCKSFPLPPISIDNQTGHKSHLSSFRYNPEPTRAGPETQLQAKRNYVHLL